MDITVTLTEKSKPIHGPEAGNNLPKGVMVVWDVQLARIIKKEVVDSIKSKDVANALNAAEWKFDSAVSDDMSKVDEKTRAALVGTHKLKFKFDGKVLSNTVRCIIGSPKHAEKEAQKPKVNNAKVAESLAQLQQVSTRFGEPRVVVKAGDKKHPKARQYVLQVGDAKWSGSIPDPEDSHIKESSRTNAIRQWEKNLKSFIAAAKAAG
jgi:hypothetical protein